MGHDQRCPVSLRPKIASVVVRAIRHPLVFFLLPLLLVNWSLLLVTTNPKHPSPVFEKDVRLCPPFDAVESKINLPLFEFLHETHRTLPANRHIQAFRSGGGGIASLGPVVVVQTDSDTASLKVAPNQFLHIPTDVRVGRLCLEPERCSRLEFSALGHSILNRALIRTLARLPSVESQ